MDLHDPKSEFHDLVLWRQQAEFATKYMTKGRLAYIDGRLQSRTWEAADGSKLRRVEVVASTELRYDAYVASKDCVIGLVLFCAHYLAAFIGPLAGEIVTA